MLSRCVQRQLFQPRRVFKTLRSRNMASRAVDPTSLSNPHECKVTKLIWNVSADFTRQVLHGSVDVHAEAQQDGVKELVLDTKTLSIKAVSTAGDHSVKIAHSFGPEHEVFGRALHIPVGGAAGLKHGEHVSVRVEYETSPTALAIQWLSPSQTAGKKHPYLFTQCQAIHARTMVPCQDTPSVKAPYMAHVTVDKDLVALMSAVPTGSVDSADGKHKVFSFDQKIPIPSYLIALAVGALVSKDIGPRSKVWSEAEMVEAGAFEFAETEKFISIAEDLVGKYVWGQYDVLLLPPSFPYGGMENPCLTFVTPTLLAGDRSNADVVAHEISHSWTGNLVSNLTWEHFWLNEGFTMYLERKILERIHGTKYFHFDSILGWKHLQDDIDHFGAENPLTNLNPKLENIDPDDAFSSVPYEKGFTLLVYLEGVVGGPAKFEPFFRAWIEANHYKCVTSSDFKKFFLDYFSKSVDAAALAAIDWDAWFNTPGMPIFKPNYDTSLADASNALADRWAAGGADITSAADLEGWTAKQIMQFLDKLSETDVPLSTIERMDALYKFTASKNSEIRFRWYILGLKVNWEPVVNPTLEFITSQGRMKFVRPLYRALYKSTVGKERAIETFKTHRDSYHAICAKLVAKDLHLA